MTTELECVLIPLSPSGGSDEPTEEGGSEGRVRGFSDALLNKRTHIDSKRLGDFLEFADRRAVGVAFDPRNL